jgi:hypothetical protein
VLTTAPQSAAPQSALDPAVFAAFVQAARAPQQQQRSQLPQQPAARGPPPGFGGAVQAGGQQGQCKGNSRTQPMAVPQVAGRKGSRAGGLESSLLQQVHSILSSLRRERQRVCRA